MPTPGATVSERPMAYCTALSSFSKPKRKTTTCGSLHPHLEDANSGGRGTDLCQLHQLFRWRHHSLWLDLIDKIVGDVDVAIVEELAYDELVQMLTVFQSWFWTIHPGSRWLQQMSTLGALKEDFFVKKTMIIIQRILVPKSQ